MRIDICALFPAILDSYLSHRLIEQAVDEHLLAINTYSFREFDAVGTGPVVHGCGGKLLRDEPVIECAKHVQQEDAQPAHLVMLTPHGRPFSQAVAHELADKSRLIFLCGRFGGFEQSVTDCLQPDEISIGDFVLNGGEIAALVILDTIIRLVPGIIGERHAPAKLAQLPLVN